MPMLDILKAQQAGATLGKIRLGEMRQAANGKMHPVKLAAFRITTDIETAAAQIAQLWGGQVQRVKLQNDTTTFQVLTEATTLPVVVPAGEVISQDYELWDRGGLQRRCDSVTQVGGKPCECPGDPQERAAKAAKGYACKPTTRLNLLLPHVEGIGTWLLESHGFYAAVGLGSAAVLLRQARAAGVMLPADLILTQRKIVRAGKTFLFPVPVLHVRESIAAIAAIAPGRSVAASLPPAPGALAIEAGPTTRREQGPDPRAIEAAQRAHENARTVELPILDEPDEPDPAPDVTPYVQRANECQDMAAIGSLLSEVRAKGVAEVELADGETLESFIIGRGFEIRAAAAQAPPAEAPEPEADPEADEPAPAWTGKVATAKRTALHTKLGAIGLTDRAEKLAFLSRYYGRELTSTNELDREDIEGILPKLTAAAHQSDPRGYLLGRGEVIVDETGAEIDPATAELLAPGGRS